ncbi:Veg family protein [Natranaerobius trueperi]|uniref:Veg protein n=1 Tax=Natranaerobius trueperi TaxID=759412 RepID=A0A226BZP0_9FIRM|nr:Veg family protein [Natranaerobius trueperi]OWZ83649.1 Veg protein [Natranaerobius trueperi]
MPAKNSLGEIKDSLDQCVGKKIKLKANGGRKKVIEKEGVLESTYPSLFIIRVDESSYSQRFTFNYADVLTKAVELTLIDDKPWNLAAK